jgi:hypothetical protein
MALEPIDEAHAIQIQAGILGRKTGHGFEERIAVAINSLSYPRKVKGADGKHVIKGNPAILLINYIAASHGQKVIKKAMAISTGALATSEEGARWLKINGITVKKCKSDLVVTFEYSSGLSRTVGISTKQCNNPTPTNAQLYFTTALGFSNLLIRGGIHISQQAIEAMKQFCGEIGYRPQDNPVTKKSRITDPRRWFWEEINANGRDEWEKIFLIMMIIVILI